jgi:hypothetical protein
MWHLELVESSAHHRKLRIAGSSRRTLRWSDVVERWRTEPFARFFTATSAYPHLARFVRRAPAAQQIELWSHLARALETRLSPARLWVSTAGLGVDWLHVRLDSRPKYYRYAPYAT